jgi:Fe-S-cluster-containing dehydrogenase component/DMSO reductase anchor subunit
VASVSPSPRPAFVFAPDRCTACEACRIACGIENGGGRDTGWRTLLTSNPARHAALPTRHLSLACNHCETPACALGCPANAYRRDAASGAVLLDPELCIGCRYCSWLCPYDAPRFDAAAGVMTKCTFCAPRLAAGARPACTEACPTAALTLGERNGAEPVLAGLGATGLGPALKLVESRRLMPPASPWGNAPVAATDVQPPGPRKIRLRSEWTLVVFTLVMPALVAWLASGLVLPERAPSLGAFLGLAALALGVSTLHLGKPLRAWRALLNLRSSWLSREAALSGLFAALGALWLVARVEIVGWAAVAAGLGLVAAIDAVYRAIPRRVKPGWHSADAVLTTLLLIGIGTDTLIVAAAAAVLKGVLLAGRWRHGRLGVPGPVAVPRLVLLAAAASGLSPWSTAFAMAAAGELLDRCAFYAELEPVTPAAGMAAAVAEAVAAGS